MNKENLIFISYFIGVKGNCPAEWADDKLKALNQTSSNVFVITSIQSKLKKYKIFSNTIFIVLKFQI